MFPEETSIETVEDKPVETQPQEGIPTESQAEEENPVEPPLQEENAVETHPQEKIPAVAQPQEEQLIQPSEHHELKKEEVSQEVPLEQQQASLEEHADVEKTESPEAVETTEEKKFKKEKKEKKGTKEKKSKKAKEKKGSKSGTKEKKSKKSKSAGRDKTSKEPPEPSWDKKEALEAAAKKENLQKAKEEKLKQMSAAESSGNFNIPVLNLSFGAAQQMVATGEKKGVKKGVKKSGTKSKKGTKSKSKSGVGAKATPTIGAYTQEELDRRSPSPSRGSDAVKRFERLREIERQIQIKKASLLPVKLFYYGKDPETYKKASPPPPIEPPKTEGQEEVPVVEAVPKSPVARAKGKKKATKSTKKRAKKSGTKKSKGKAGAKKAAPTGPSECLEIFRHLATKTLCAEYEEFPKIHDNDIAGITDIDNFTAGKSLFNIGWMYYYGMCGIKANPAKAYAYFYACATKEKNPLAYYYLSQMSTEAFGTEKNFLAASDGLIKSVEWEDFSKAGNTAAGICREAMDFYAQVGRALFTSEEVSNYQLGRMWEEGKYRTLEPQTEDERTAAAAILASAPVNIVATVKPVARAPSSSPKPAPQTAADKKNKEKSKKSPAMEEKVSVGAVVPPVPEGFKVVTHNADVNIAMGYYKKCNKGAGQRRLETLEMLEEHERKKKEMMGKKKEQIRIKVDSRRLADELNKSAAEEQLAAAAAKKRNSSVKAALGETVAISS